MEIKKRRLPKPTGDIVVTGRATPEVHDKFLLIATREEVELLRKAAGAYYGQLLVRDQVNGDVPAAYEKNQPQAYDVGQLFVTLQTLPETHR